MKFSDWAVIAVFGILGYLLVGSALNWLEEKKKAREKSGGSNESSDRDAGDFHRASGDAFGTAPSQASNWHEVLEVSELATVEQIRTAYKQKISQYHPDKVADMGLEIRELAETRSKEINAAYDQALKARSP